ncbi:MAG: energy transducer TonB [Candidatus Acidiferrum sp.]
MILKLSRTTATVLLVLAAVVSSATGGQTEKPSHHCRPVLTSPIKPDWPKNLQGATTKVTVKFRIEQDGTVSNAAVEKSSGRDDVDAAALSAVQKAKYKPLPADCGTIESKLTLTIDLVQK